jgi:hypothetical protein
MNQDFEDELSPQERLAFEALPREKAPSSLLEERVVRSLKQTGLLRPERKLWRPSVPRLGLAVAASLLFFVLGGAAALKWLAGPPPKTNAPEFMLVLRQAPEQSKHGSAEEELRIAKEYGNWARKLTEQGVLADGEKLKDEARILSVVDGRPVASTNPVEQNRMGIAGYFLINAQDYEQAIKVAASCPHLKYGGMIEVRQIDRF